MEIPYFHIDAFTQKKHGGNPAGVCLLEEWIDEIKMQKIAAENNLSETAFIVKSDSQYQIRWFTPITEINLCGHATLASAFVLLSITKQEINRVTFCSHLSGELSVEDNNGKLYLNFPSLPPKQCEVPSNIEKALGIAPLEVLLADDYLLTYENEEEIFSICPNFEEMKKLNARGVIVTAKGTSFDFVSRFFAPKFGINEDPVTGSAHCTLIPYWRHKLNKTELYARQVSQRGGELYCKDNGARVDIGGHAVCYMYGKITI